MKLEVLQTLSMAFFALSFGLFIYLLFAFSVEHFSYLCVSFVLYLLFSRMADTEAKLK